jgi:hypothetical protein
MASQIERCGPATEMATSNARWRRTTRRLGSASALRRCTTGICVRIHAPSPKFQEHRQATIAESHADGRERTQAAQGLLAIARRTVAHRAIVHRNQPRARRWPGDTPPALTPPASGAREGLDLFFGQSPGGCGDRASGRRPPVLVSRFHGAAIAAPELLQPEPAELLLPPVERLVADAEPATHFGDLLAASTW